MCSNAVYILLRCCNCGLPVINKRICYVMNLRLSVVAFCCSLYFNHRNSEACPVNKTDEKSVEFTMNRVLMKIFQTKSADTIQQCCWYFGITDTKSRIVNRKIKFLVKYCNSQNELCKIFADVGSRESADLSTEVERLANSAK